MLLLIKLRFKDGNIFNRVLFVPRTLRNDRMCNQRAMDFAMSGLVLSILIAKKAFVKLNFFTPACADFSAKKGSRGMAAKVSGNVFLGCVLFSGFFLSLPLGFLTFFGKNDLFPQKQPSTLSHMLFLVLLFLGVHHFFKHGLAQIEGFGVGSKDQTLEVAKTLCQIPRKKARDGRAGCRMLKKPSMERKGSGKKKVASFLASYKVQFFARIFTR